MLTIHPNVRTTPVVRAEIARSAERTGALAERYSVSAETIRKWRKRGAADCRDHHSRPHKLPWKHLVARIGPGGAEGPGEPWCTDPLGGARNRPGVEGCP